jgi:aminomethyltransferase
VSTEHDTRRFLPTPFHARTSVACETNDWAPWKAYTVADSYTEVVQEYFALRNGTGVFDLTPMTKYRVTGVDAGAYLDRLVTRDLSKLAIGQVAYCVWCDDAGQVIDDGTVFRLGKDDYRLCSQERHLDWLSWAAIGFDVDVRDETEEVAALAVQGPTSCSVLKRMGLHGIEDLKPFGVSGFNHEAGALTVSRTGFTGDLGYELWMAPEDALALWDALMVAGKDYQIRPIGARALDG